jgi:hypothetical protein
MVNLRDHVTRGYRRRSKNKVSGSKSDREQLIKALGALAESDVLKPICGRLTVAEWIRGKTDRHDPTRMR